MALGQLGHLQTHPKYYRKPLIALETCLNSKWNWSRTVSPCGTEVPARGNATAKGWPAAQPVYDLQSQVWRRSTWIRPFQQSIAECPAFWTSVRDEAATLPEPTRRVRVVTGFHLAGRLINKNAWWKRNQKCCKAMSVKRCYASRTSLGGRTQPFASESELRALSTSPT